MNIEKINVGILGATGIVGQRLVQMLEHHPWFEVGFLAASEKSAGKTYQEACSWKLTAPMPAFAKEMIVERIGEPPRRQAKLVFSSLDVSIATEVEDAFARAGYAVISNSSSYRMEEDVPLVIPEINAEHFALLERQRKKRGFNRGFIVTNPNCSATALALALAPLDQHFEIETVFVTTAQAVSGAGYPGVASLDVLGNILPFIPNEEEKIERETKKIFGKISDGAIVSHPMNISAQSTRVPVIDAHTEMVSIKFKRSASAGEVREILLRYRSKLDLPSAPTKPVIVRDEADRPQPRLDAEVARGMATVVGRIRKCPVFDVKFVLVGHNTIRGAAGAAILNAEVLKAEGYLA